MEAGPQSSIKTIEAPQLSRSQKKRLKKVQHKKALKEVDTKKKATVHKAEGPAFKRIHDDIAHFSTLYKQAEKLVKDKEAEYYQKL
jgi:hypothetical protein